MFYKNIIAFAADMTADSSGGAARKGAEASKEKMERDELEIQEDSEAERQDYFSENYRSDNLQKFYTCFFFHFNFAYPRNAIEKS